MRWRPTAGILLAALAVAACGSSTAHPATHTAVAAGATGSAASTSASASSTTAAASTSAPASSTRASSTPASSTTPASASATPTTTSSASRPPEVPASRDKGRAGTRKTVQSGAIAPAGFKVAGGRLSPPTVSLPSGMAIRLAVTDGDRADHTVELVARRRYTLHVAPGKGATARVPGLPNGTYRVLVDGSARGQLLIGAQGGP